MQENNYNWTNKSQISKVNINKLSKTDSDIQSLDYEGAIIYDKRPYLKIY